jgi:hypothetical protein
MMVKLAQEMDLIDVQGCYFSRKTIWSVTGTLLTVQGCGFGILSGFIGSTELIG